MAYWMTTDADGEHQVRTNNNRILFRYPANMEAAATDHVRRLQAKEQASVRSEIIANSLKRISEITDVSESDPKEMERLLRRVRDIAEEGLRK